MMPWRRAGYVPVLLLALASAAGTSSARAPASISDQDPQEDSAAAVDRARRAQATFERRREGWMSVERGGWGNNCDEVLGRFCLTMGEVGDWWPGEEREELVEARDGLIDELGALAGAAPGDPWITGQRVWYLGEAGRWPEALDVARRCTAPRPGWCRALEATALHMMTRYVEAEAAFDRALAAMPHDEARAWRDLRPLLDGKARDRLERARNAGPADEAAALERLWRFADPLLLVPGNDRRTEHLARRTMERVREDARNPYGLSWGRDLSELLVRYGWEVGWQRTFPRPGDLSLHGSVIGRQHPYTRAYVPSGDVLDAPLDAEPERWNPGDRPLAPSGYAPPYAPVLLPAPSQIAVFPHGDSVSVVARVEMPADTTYHAGHDHPPLELPARWAGTAERVGLFLQPLDGGAAFGVEASGDRPDALVVDAPVGTYMLSLERWDPASGRAGRVRRGLAVPRYPPDVPILSDLLLADPPGRGESIADVLPYVFARDSVAPGDTVRVAWQVAGLGWERLSLAHELELERLDGGILRAAGRALGLLGDPPRVALDWTEAGPESPGPTFRSVLLTLPQDLGEGRYRLRLRIRMAGREPLVSERELRVQRRGA
jgi:hypothetical protein